MNGTMTKTDVEAQRAAAESERYVSPRVNIIETGDAYVLEADMPGVSKDGLEILLNQSELTLVGRRSPGPAGVELVYRESSPLPYRRTFELDPAIDTEAIDARLEHGVLTLTLPKAEKVKPRKITIQ